MIERLYLRASHRLNSSVCESRLQIKREARRAHTDDEDQPVGRGSTIRLAVDFEESHARNDGTDEVDVEYGRNINQMENHGQSQECEAWKARHDAPAYGVLRSYTRRRDSRIVPVR